MEFKILHVVEGVDKNLGGQPVALFGILNVKSDGTGASIV